jgi:hypothetical protein
MLIDRSTQLTHANYGEEISESMHAQGRCGVSKVTPPGLSGKDQGDGGKGRALQPKFSDWPFEQFAEFRSQLTKLRQRVLELDTETKRKFEEEARQLGLDDVARGNRPVDPEK